jgi:alpha-aminoadipate carrier protein LysW
MATCPECDAEIEIDDDDLEDLQIGDAFECADCGSALRIATLDPLEFDIDDDEDEEEDDDAKEKDKEDDDATLDDVDDEDDDGDDDNWDE